MANQPEALGEELLIIQKEFDGFDDTRERLDLLALGKAGSELYANVAPGRDHWLNSGSGLKRAERTFGAEIPRLRSALRSQ